MITSNNRANLKSLGPKTPVPVRFRLRAPNTASYPDSQPKIFLSAAQFLKIRIIGIKLLAARVSTAQYL